MKWTNWIGLIELKYTLVSQFNIILIQNLQVLQINSDWSWASIYWKCLYTKYCMVCNSLILKCEPTQMNFVVGNRVCLTKWQDFKWPNLLTYTKVIGTRSPSMLYNTSREMYAETGRPFSVIRPLKLTVGVFGPNRVKNGINDSTVDTKAKNVIRKCRRPIFVSIRRISSFYMTITYYTVLLGNNNVKFT
jgi:hypothetical protein